MFHALADPTRRAMVRSLSGGERTVAELAAPHPIPPAAASEHVKVLERAGLVRHTVLGRRHVCRLDAAPLAAATCASTRTSGTGGSTPWSATSQPRRGLDRRPAPRASEPRAPGVPDDPSDYATLREDWNVWLDMLEKSGAP